MATKKKIEQDMAIFWRRVPSTVTRKKMDGNDREDGTRHGNFLGEECHQRWQEKRWMATTKKMEQDMAFLRGKNAIKGDKKEDGWRRKRRLNKTWQFFGEECHQR